MNERIKLLVKQAGGIGHDDDGNELTPVLVGTSLEKFAELIVQECADQIISKGTDWVDFAPSQTGVRPEYWNMAQQIKQHFGVEE